MLLLLLLLRCCYDCYDCGVLMLLLLLALLLMEMMVVGGRGDGDVSTLVCRYYQIQVWGLKKHAGYRREYGQKFTTRASVVPFLL